MVRAAISAEGTSEELEAPLEVLEVSAEEISEEPEALAEDDSKEQHLDQRSLGQVDYLKIKLP